MDYLVELGMNPNIISDLKNNYDEKQLFLLDVNEDNVKKVFNYFKSKGISVNTIEEILLHNMNIFLMDVVVIKSSFEKYNINLLIGYINEDVSILDKIL